ncbi:MAG: 1,2-phenylacetyl-CoA epoxidase subunit PaaD [Flavobacteriales bacterium]|nr:1,2-phenylacetyl-CoA epoxidase subunit PaaD [Flavobacteriales bacterium]
MKNTETTNSGNKISVADVWKLLERVVDPEIPVLNVVEMGIVRDVKISDEGKVEVIITPTYSGCPAMRTIEEDIEAVLKEKFITHYSFHTILSPAWTTDWMTDEAREKLQSYGVSPPQKGSADKNLLIGRLKEVKCPRCSSTNTQMISQFGSTACKSLYKCDACLEPFDYFKCI